MSILSGWIKERCYKKTDAGFKKASRDTSSETVFMNNGVTLETALVTLETALDGKQLKVLTEAQYNALSNAEKNNPFVIYMYY